MHRILIFANGALPSLEQAQRLLQKDDYIICADGGARHARALGIEPNLVLGDMDSLDKAAWKELEASRVPVELFPREKNETDLEIALTRAFELEPKEILIIAALGGRIDQTLANIALLTDPRFSACDLRLDDGVEEIFFCRHQAEVRGRSGDIVSLLPWGAPVHGIRTRGLKWSLNDETLYPEKTRGVSNEMIADVASIHIRSGLLLVVHRRRSSHPHNPRLLT